MKLIQPDIHECEVKPACNPTVQKLPARLIIKPEVAVVARNKSITFAAFLLDNGIEIPLETGVQFFSATPNIAVIGVNSGVATGVAQGIATITARYGQLTAAARLEVRQNCVVPNHYALIIDDSISMGASFSNTFPTKIQYARAAAQAFLNCLSSQEQVAIFSGLDESIGFTTNSNNLSAFVKSIVCTATKTNLAAMLGKARDAFAAANIAASGRVYILITDGFNNFGDDLASYAASIKDEGSIIMVLGLRNFGDNYDLMTRVASGGFYLNAIPNNEVEAMQWLNGLKASLCGGNCYSVAGKGTMLAGQPQLNYTGFKNWDVISGLVDLIGNGTNQFYDFLPGNGLYVDLCGTPPTWSDPSGWGTLKTKESLMGWLGENYTLTVRLAGNQRQPRTDTVTIRVLEENGQEVAAKTVLLDWLDDFAEFELTFTGASHLFKIEISAMPMLGGITVFGPLLDSVKLVDSNGQVIFFDDFDSENLHFIPPQCGDSIVFDLNYGYVPPADNISGIYRLTYDNYMVVRNYDCGSGCGCLDYWPPQNADPNPTTLIDFETSPPEPVTYSSTRTYTALCPESPDQSVTASATATSLVSQEDADSKALALARQKAEAALLGFCVPSISKFSGLLNFALAGGYSQNDRIIHYQGYNGKVGPITTPDPNQKDMGDWGYQYGPLVVGDYGDYWNPGLPPPCPPAYAGLPDGYGSGFTSLRDSKFNFLPGVYLIMPSAADFLLKATLYANYPNIFLNTLKIYAPNGCLSLAPNNYPFMIYGLPAGIYDVYVFGRLIEPGFDLGGKYSWQVIDSDDSVVASGEAIELNTPLIPYGPYLQENHHYAKFSGIVIQAGYALKIISMAINDSLNFINGIQIKKRI